MNRPNLKSLRVFRAVAQHLNFRLAAEDLHVTRGAVAQQIRQLEADLGVKLFNRLPRGLSLTPLAEEYYVAIQQALEIIENATRSISASNSRVTVTMTPSMAAKWLMPRLETFETLHPDINLQVVTSDNLTDFQSDGVDIAIRYGNFGAEKSLMTEHFVRPNLSAVCSPAYAKKHCSEYAIDNASMYRVDNPETFSMHRLIQDRHRYWDTWLKDMKLKTAERTLAFNQTSLAIDAAVSGQGITLVFDILVRDHLDRGELVPLWEHVAPEGQGYYLAHQHQNKPLSAPVTAVRQWLREALIESTSQSKVNHRCNR